MKVKIFALVAAFFMLMGGSAWAQSDVKGDVNKDGVVNEQDIAAILAIMAKNNGVAEKTKYYWYVGQENPADNSTITSTVGAEGWRLIDNPNTVSQSNPLFDTTTTSDDRIVGTSKTYWFIALPADKSYKIYDSDYADQIAAGNFEKQSSTVSFNNVKYTVYKGVGTARNFDGYTIY
jgi:hypothetical protein